MGRAAAAADPPPGASAPCAVHCPACAPPPFSPRVTRASRRAVTARVSRIRGPAERFEASTCPRVDASVPLRTIYRPRVGMGAGLEMPRSRGALVLQVRPCLVGLAACNGCWHACAAERLVLAIRAPL